MRKVKIISITIASILFVTCLTLFLTSRYKWKLLRYFVEPPKWERWDIGLIKEMPLDSIGTLKPKNGNLLGTWKMTEAYLEKKLEDTSITFSNDGSFFCESTDTTAIPILNMLFGEGDTSTVDIKGKFKCYDIGNSTWYCPTGIETSIPLIFFSDNGEELVRAVFAYASCDNTFEIAFVYMPDPYYDNVERKCLITLTKEQ